MSTRTEALRDQLAEAQRRGLTALATELESEIAEAEGLSLTGDGDTRYALSAEDIAATTGLTLEEAHDRIAQRRMSPIQNRDPGDETTAT